MRIRAFWSAYILVILTILPLKVAEAATCNPGDFGRFVRSLQCLDCDKVLRATIDGLLERGTKKRDLMIWSFQASEDVSAAARRQIFDFGGTYPNFPHVIVDQKNGVVIIPGNDEDVTYAIDFFLESMLNRAKDAGYPDVEQMPVSIKAFSADQYLSEMDGRGSIARHRGSEDSVLGLMIENKLIASLKGSWLDILIGVRRWRAAARQEVERPRATLQRVIARRRAELEVDSHKFRFENEPAPPEPEPEGMITTFDEDGTVLESEPIISLFGDRKALERMQEEMNAAIPFAPTFANPFEEAIPLRSVYGALSPTDARRIDLELYSIIETTHFSVKRLHQTLGDRTVKEYIDFARELNYDTLTRLRDLLNSIPETPANALIREAISDTHAQLARRFNNRAFESSYNGIQHLMVTKPPRPREIEAVINSAMSPTRNFTAELRYALRLPGLQAKGVHVRNLPEIQNLLAGLETPREIDGVLDGIFPSRDLFRVDIDMVFNHGKGWMEYKNTVAPVAMDNLSWKEYTKQAKRQVAARTAMIKRGLLPEDHRLHWTFQGGITARAAQALREIGIHEVGPLPID